MCQSTAIVPPSPLPPYQHRAGKCPCCQAELSYGDSGIQDDQYAYDWCCAQCGATGKEWHALHFEEHIVDGAAPQLSAGLKKFTIIAEYWDNEQGFSTLVEARDDDHAVELAQTEVRKAFAAERLETRQQAIAAGQQVVSEADFAEEEAEYADISPLRIWAVLLGWFSMVYLRSADERD